MRVWPLLLISLNSVMLPDPSLMGVKIVTRQVSAVASDTRTEYLTANALRNEWQSHVGDRTGPPMASILQRGATNRVYVLDLQAHEYISADSFGGASGKHGSVGYSNAVLQIWIDSTDTGERQDMFGHQARHIITREKRVASPGACSRSSVRETDGWYIDEAVLPEWQHAKRKATLVVADFGGCLDKTDRIDIHRTGVEPGFPLKVNTTEWTEVFDLDGRKKMIANNFGSEVTLLQEGPLDPSLFDVPGDFHRVEKLRDWYTAPPPRRQVSGWDWFKEKVAEIFR